MSGLGACAATDRGVHGRAGREDGCIGALRFGLLPLAGPGEAAGAGGQDHEAVAAPVPVVAGGGEDARLSPQRP
ncbi:hypothetical protein N566_00240 [Streptomycetaceae bacterium MP113-05]|nr:hypothetical protein N566_00240 [Streptomycetaceae bacterium MP113-05]